VVPLPLLLLLLLMRELKRLATVAPNLIGCLVQVAILMIRSARRPRGRRRRRSQLHAPTIVRNCLDEPAWLPPRPKR
jgi:hypothetical protein